MVRNQRQIRNVQFQSSQHNYNDVRFREASLIKMNEQTDHVQSKLNHNIAKQIMISIISFYLEGDNTYCIFQLQACSYIFSNTRRISQCFIAYTLLKQNTFYSTNRLLSFYLLLFSKHRLWVFVGYNQLLCLLFMMTYIF